MANGECVIYIYRYIMKVRYLLFVGDNDGDDDDDGDGVFLQ